MKQLRCALYPRVSTEEQFIHGLSLPAQVKDLTEYANRMGYKIVDIYADEGVSARKPVSKRPALLRLLRDVEANKIDIILVTKLDRWFRNIKEYQTTQEILEKHNCYWRTIFEDYDTSTANGQMIVNIMLAVAQNECDRTSERIKVVLEHKVKNGEHVTGAAPYGYITVNKKLEKDPERQHIVEEIFSYYFKTFSIHQTVAYISNKYSDDPKLTAYKINRILHTETYCGRYKGISGYYPAYITEQQFANLQAISVSKKRPHTSEPFLFSGLIKCPVCGRNMTGFVKKQKLKNGSYSYYRRYKCHAKFDIHPGACITESIVETYMIERLWPELQNCIYKAHLVQKVPREDKTPQIRAEMERLNKLYQKGRISDEYYEEQYSMLEDKLSSCNSSLDEDKLVSYQNIEKELSGNWYDIYKDLDAAHKQTFWKRIIKEIYVDKETRKICGFSFLV